MKTEQIVYVLIGGTSGIGAELAKQLEHDNAIVHVASRKTGLDICNAQSVCDYFENIGAFDHLIITAGSYAPAGKVVDVEVSQAQSAFNTKFWGTINSVKHAVRYIKIGGSYNFWLWHVVVKIVANTYVRNSH